MTIFEKKRLERDKFRKLRDEISLNQINNVEKNVRLYIDSFVKGYKNIGYIAIYWPLKNEVDLRSLKKKFTLALPRCEGKKELLFYPWDEKPLTKDSEWILSPNNSSPLSHLQIRMIFVPCLAVDKNLTRLGYGGGYYDRTFAYLNKINHRFISVAYAYEEQKLDYIPIDKFDFKVDYVITEKNLYSFQ